MAEIPSHFASAAPVDAESAGFLRQMAALVPGIIYVFNHQTMSNEYVNRSIAELLGYNPDEIRAMGDELFANIVHPDDFDRLAEHVGSLQDLTTGEQAVWEYRAIRRDGRIVWLRSIETVFTRAADGGVLRHIGIAFDITAEKNAQLRLEKLNADLEQRVRERTQELERLNNELEARVDDRTAQLRMANRELEQLSYIATHDLKGPINNMTSLTYMLEEARDRLAPEDIETLGWMRSICDQASEKLEALVSIAQANAVLCDPFEAVPLAEVTDRVLAAHQARINEAQAVVDMEFVAPSVTFLQAEVQNILDALLTNALQYRDPDRLLRIDLRSVATEADVVLTVADNGSGFAMPRDQDKVFGLFQRAHVVLQGSGVSLYAVKRIIEQVGGSIDAASSPGVGSTFTLRFPKTPTRHGRGRRCDAR